MMIIKNIKNYKYIFIFNFVLFLSIILFSNFYNNKNSFESNIDSERLLDFDLIIKKEELKKILNNKNKILKNGNGFMLRKEHKWYNAKLKIDNKVFDVEIRLKGDQVEDHLIGDNLFSLRIKGDYVTDIGTDHFSLHKVKARGDMLEKILMDEMINNKIMSPKYELVKFSVNNVYKGYMAFEEAISNSMIKNNLSQISPIIYLDENYLWEERREDRKHKKILKSNYSNYEKMINLPLKSHMKKNSEEKFIEIQRLAFSKLNRFYNNKNIKYEALFNFEKFARWFVVLHSWNSEHGTIDHNLKLYFNPVTYKFEPISFDNHVQININHKNQSFIIEKLLGNEDFIKEVITISNSYNQRLKSKEFMDELKYKIQKYKSIDENFITYKFEDLYEKLLSNINIINNEYLRKYNSDNNYRNIISEPGININHSKFPAQIYLTTDIIGNKSLKIRNFINSNLKINLYHFNKIGEKKSVKTIDVSKAIKDSQIDVKINEKLFEKKIESEIEYLDLNYKNNLPMISVNIIDFDKYNYDLDLEKYFSIENNVLKPLNNKLIINKNLYVPKKYKIIIDKKLDIILNNSLILIESDLLSNKNINIELIGNKLSGLIFSNNDVKIDKLAINDHRNIENKSLKILSKTLSSNNSELIIGELKIQNSTTEDAINLYDSNIVIKNLIIENSKNDALDCDNSKMLITNLIIDSSGNDGIDFDSCDASLEKINIKKSIDKAVSIGGKSKITIKNARLFDNYIDIANKDDSNTLIENIHSNNKNQYQILSYQKTKFLKRRANLKILKHNNLQNSMVVSTNPNIININDINFKNTDLTFDQYQFLIEVIRQ